MRYLITALLALTLIACSASSSPENTEPRITADTERYWNEILELEYWETQSDSEAPEVYINGEALARINLLSYSSQGLSFKLDVPERKRSQDVTLTVQSQGQNLDLNINGERSPTYKLRPQGVANAGRLNILIPCQERTRSVLERLFEKSDNFVLLDYFGDIESLGETSLGASQHSDPWCLMVIGFEDQANNQALKRLDDIIKSRLTSNRAIAISPDFFMYSYDPGVASFDSSCDDDSILSSESATAKDVLLTNINSIIAKPDTLTGEGVTIAFLDGGVTNASSFLNESATASLSRRFTEADYPNPNSLAKDINDDFDCDETNFVDGHGSLVESILKQVAPEANLLSLKICAENGSCNTSSFVKAMLYIRNRYEGFPEIDIINMSFGGDVKRDKVFEALIIDMLKTRTDTLMVASLGNSSDDEAHYPAQYQNSYPNVVAVAAAKLNTDDTWSLAAFNTQGTLESLTTPPLAAPGVSIIVEGLGNPEGITGTSFAAPIVSAVAALSKSADETQTPLQLIRGLRQASDTDYGMQFTQVP